MINTEQMKNLSVLDHGFMVNEYFLDLYKHLKYKKDLSLDWKLPDWIFDPLIFDEINTLDLDLVSQYQTYHDCGKPYCIEFDDEGRKHFPNHAEISHRTYLEVFGNTLYHQKVAELIIDDMLIHLLKNEGVYDFSKNKNCLILLITGLAEIHANAEMFGGIESTSFKIKWKNINKRGKAILKEIKKGEIK